MNEPCIQVDNPDYTGFLSELTHPDDCIQALNDNIQGFTDLMNLPATERYNFTYRYPLRIKDNLGGYQLYILCVTMLLADEENMPWLLLINTDRVPEYCANNKYKVDKNDKKVLIPAEKKYPTRKAELSERHLDILNLVKEGHDSTSIATQLFLSHHTINNHFTDIRRKLNVKNIQFATIYAKMTGMLQTLFVFVNLSEEMI
jgi:DNA-binding CsgD family transcriptional regulator